MGRNKEFLLLLLSFVVVVNLCDAEIFRMSSQKDWCIHLCDGTPMPSIYKDRFLKERIEREYLTSCCQRGCRFYDLASLQKPPHFNSSLYTCSFSCMDAYLSSGLQNMVACQIGCALMADQQTTGFKPYISVVAHLEDGGRPYFLFMDIPVSENIAIREESIPIGDTKFEFPESIFPEISKTLPMDSESIDYSISSEYSGENEKSEKSSLGSDWLQCASRHTGIPRWLLAFAIATAALSALWLCLAPEKASYTKKVTIVEPTSKIMVALPDETFMHEKPPPNYHEVVNTDDFNLKV